MLAVYLLDCGMVWLIDAPKLWAFLERDGKLLDERHGKTVLPWATIKQLGGELVDLRCVPYLSFEQYRALHAADPLQRPTGGSSTVAEGANA